MLLIIFILLVTPLSVNADVLIAPVKVLRNYDGDTFTAQFEIYPNITATTGVRVVGVDTPEIGKAKCPKEKEAGIAARDYVTEQLKKQVAIRIIGEDVYPKRIDAIVYVDNVRLDKLLIDAGHGRLMKKGARRHGWCS